MHDDINRCEARKTVSIHAFITDLAGQFEIKCVLRDVSRNGCRIVSSRVHDLPDVVLVIPEGFAAPMRGMVVWKRSNLAGVCFEHGCTPEQRTVIASTQTALQSEDRDAGTESYKARPVLSYSDRLEKFRTAAL